MDIALDFIEKEEGVEMERAVQSKEVAKGERGTFVDSKYCVCFLTELCAAANVDIDQGDHLF